MKLPEFLKLLITYYKTKQLTVNTSKLELQGILNDNDTQVQEQLSEQYGLQQFIVINKMMPTNKPIIDQQKNSVDDLSYMSKLKLVNIQDQIDKCDQSSIAIIQQYVYISYLRQHNQLTNSNYIFITDIENKQNNSPIMINNELLSLIFLFDSQTGKYVEYELMNYTQQKTMAQSFNLKHYQARNQKQYFIDEEYYSDNESCSQYSYSYEDETIQESVIDEVVGIKTQQVNQDSQPSTLYFSNRMSKQQLLNNIDLKDNGNFLIKKFNYEQTINQLNFNTEASKYIVHQSNNIFLIKWVGCSYIHLTWEHEDNLKLLGSYNKVVNYKTKVNQQQNNLRDVQTIYEQEIILNQINQFEHLYQKKQVIQKILCISQIDDNTFNVIKNNSINNNLSNQIFLIKWQECHYSQSTWELYEDLLHCSYIDQQMLQNQIYMHKQKLLIFCNLNCMRANNNLNHQFIQFSDQQPSFIKTSNSELKLKTHQIRGVNILLNSWCQNRNMILADQVGLGKTIQTVAFLSALFYWYNSRGPYIIVVPLSTIPAWRETFLNWFPEAQCVVLQGTKEDRDVIIQNEFMYDQLLTFNVVITTPSTVIIEFEFLKQFNYQVLCVDEAHMIKNLQSKRAITLIQLNTQAKLLITATPLQNNLMEFYSLLHFLDPSKFSNPQFILDIGSLQQFKSAIDNQFADDYKVLKIINTIRPYIIRRDNSQIDVQIPDKKEYTLYVNLTKMQVYYIQEIHKQNVEILNKHSSKNNNLLNVLIQLRKVCNHPYMFQDYAIGDMKLYDIVKNSGKFELLDQLLPKLITGGHRVLIFSQFLYCIKIIMRYCYLKQFRYLFLSGSTCIEERAKLIDIFNMQNSAYPVFILSTRAGGQGINLQSADRVIIFDSDFNPQIDAQACGRVHRIGQTRPVEIYRFITKNSVEEHIMKIAQQKLLLDYTFVQTSTEQKQNEIRSIIIEGINNINNIPDLSNELQSIIQNTSQQELIFQNQQYEEETEEDDMEHNQIKQSNIQLIFCDQIKQLYSTVQHSFKLLFQKQQINIILDVLLKLLDFCNFNNMSQVCGQSIFNTNYNQFSDIVDQIQLSQYEIDMLQSLYLSVIKVVKDNDYILLQICRDYCQMCIGQCITKSQYDNLLHSLFMQETNKILRYLFSFVFQICNIKTLYQPFYLYLLSEYHVCSYFKGDNVVLSQQDILYCYSIKK